ncbi:hypothetical protein ColTof4_01464 [Colletotrichum tofieldiae]|nr:hypothetical protein ColTof3_08720 [Colletotrichum tofieldiae]GKT69041.1 hypothetical protein ColTof4_01464 [Colletotrichum tofieldiae]GKT96909.1 hypothetical protein Ct61P_14759 [Colletotrichum tofieldiae]
MPRWNQSREAAAQHDSGIARLAGDLLTALNDVKITEQRPTTMSKIAGGSRKRKPAATNADSPDDSEEEETESPRSARRV